MKIALIGYGKMGQAIEKAAQSRGHEIVLRITSSNRHEFTTEKIRRADVAIEFTSPESADTNVMECLSAGVSVVCGTTGWNDRLQHARDNATEHKVAFLHASNFSVGVNVFFEINKLLASLMNGKTGYNVQVEETHHIHKKDAPGGTAITIAEQIIQNLTNKSGWALNESSSVEILPIFAHRIDEVPGTHKVTYSSAIDDIDIIHTAHNREGFALGAVLAAEFVAGKSGVFTMKDVLGIA
ncbi:MAG: 4-hydroxy-tetrahydrodipicolinate reductase [Taibaiella sp.]|nr:4-hydroxy-tetrahydrodipicolinate reductase [Taibaiella sp.]